METVHIPPDSQKRLIDLSRKTLENFVLGRQRRPDRNEDPYLLSADYGAFVSLHKGEELRGCIGTCFPTRPLYQTVIEMTQAAASRDHRVAPVAGYELPEIGIEISILSPLQLARDPLSLTVGKHGLHVTSGEHRGVLLPQVAVQYRWDIETFLGQTCLKAGLPKNGWKSAEAEVMAFTALIIGEKR